MTVKQMGIGILTDLKQSIEIYREDLGKVVSHEGELFVIVGEDILETDMDFSYNRMLTLKPYIREEDDFTVDLKQLTTISYTKQKHPYTVQEQIVPYTLKGFCINSITDEVLVMFHRQVPIGR